MPVSEKVKALLDKFSAATIKAAIADNPAIMTASGWRVDEDGIPVQDAMDEEGTERLRKSLAEIAMIPLGDVAAEFLMAIPAIAKGLGAMKTVIKRNSPHGRKLTARVKEALSHIDDIVSAENVADVNPALREYLVKEGVDPKILTDDALEKLTRARQLAVENAASSAPGRYVMRNAPGEDGYQFYTAFENGYPKARPSWPDNAVGYVGVEPLQNGDTGIQMIENVTRREYPNPEAHGVSETLMNAVIKDRGHVVSGRELLSPDVTTHVWEKYPDKELIGNYGKWKTASRTFTEGHPVYKITSPTYDVPLKYGDIFSAESIDDAGTFLVDFNKGPEFALGGAMEKDYRSGGSIHIKPSHRGRLTELKARTGKSEAELYNDGNPAHKRMIVFARNARKWKHDEGGPIETDYANKWDRISNARYTMANDALARSGSSKTDADRLARILAAQSALEAGWVDDVKGNNYSGYMSNGKRMNFDTTDDFWDYHIRNLDERWPGWRDAQSVEDYYNVVNNTALGLTTKELFNEYNKNHRDNPAYIYAPDWENENYLKKLQGVYDKYISTYVKPTFDAGGFIEKYGADNILRLLKSRKY